jgi:hypothetical protein
MLSQMQELVRQVHNALTEPWNKGVFARNRVGCTERPRSHVFSGRTVRRSSLRDISPLTVLSFMASLADRAGRGGEVRADCGRGHGPGPGSSVPGRRHHHAVLVLCRERRAVEPQARHHRVQRPLVCLLDGAAIYISDPLPGCTHDAKGISPPRRSPRLSRTLVTGSWIKAQRHQRRRSDLLCAATERGTL